jgi:transposase
VEAVASIKVFDPVSVPFSVLEELQQPRALVERLRQVNQRLRQENWRLRGELDVARAGLDQAQRQAAPLSMRPPKPQPKGPGRRARKVYCRQSSRLPATHQQCLGQLVRRVRDLEAMATCGAVHYPRKLIELFTEANHLCHRFKRGEVSAEQLAQARKTIDGRLLRLAWPARKVPACKTWSGHLWQHRDNWFTFLSPPAIEPTNWEGEQAIRPVVNWKIWGGNRTWSDGRAQEVLMSSLEKCQRAGRPGLDLVSQTSRAFANPLLPRPILLTPR